MESPNTFHNGNLTIRVMKFQVFITELNIANAFSLKSHYRSTSLVQHYDVPEHSIAKKCSKIFGNACEPNLCASPILQKDPLLGLGSSSIASSGIVFLLSALLKLFSCETKGFGKT